jgi:hypothetical protein
MILFTKNSVNRGVAQFGSALAWGARGRRFKSFRPDQLNQRLTKVDKSKNEKIWFRDTNFFLNNTY